MNTDTEGNHERHEMTEGIEAGEKNLREAIDALASVERRPVMTEKEHNAFPHGRF